MVMVVEAKETIEILEIISAAVGRGIIVLDQWTSCVAEIRVAENILDGRGHVDKRLLENQYQ